MRKRSRPFAVGDLVLESRENTLEGCNHFLILKSIKAEGIHKYKVYWIEADEYLGPIALAEAPGWTYAVVSTTSNNE